MTEISPSKLTFVSGDLFDAPSNSILVHACNTRGSWGGGIAVTFKKRFPSAFDAYKQYCQVHGDDLLGSCFLVDAEDGSGRMVACLFTSKQYGKNKDPPASILAATETAVNDLVRKNVGGRPLHACRFNSGKFAVPWGDTQKVLEKLEVEMTIYEPKDG